MLEPSDLLERNRAWADRMRSDDAAYFARLARQQTPRFLWIGCADSRVPATVITGLDPGEVFVHRNVANLVPRTDLNALTVLAYAVSVLRVEHVIVCGHHGCGGVAAAIDGQSHGMLDNWLGHLKDVAAKHERVLGEASDDASRVSRLAELNAIEQARNVCHTSIVQAAWARGQTLSVRAWIYGLQDGLLRGLGFEARGPEELEPVYRFSTEGVG